MTSQVLEIPLLVPGRRLEITQLRREIHRLRLDVRQLRDRASRKELIALELEAKLESMLTAVELRKRRQQQQRQWKRRVGL